ncbi:MAG TPA: YCF48-related protein [Nevskia sp.]|nr:YCF48-related protein [Nevskia sp.]
MKMTTWLGSMAGAILLLSLPSLAQQQDDSDGDTGTDTTLVPIPARILPRAESGLMLDVARSGSGLVAVGAHGDILVSADGKKWQQVPAPTDTTLTRVRFLDATHGWAVGYDGAVLASGDGGRTWALQQFDAAWGRPYFDVLFFDARNGLLAGANGVLKKTADGGKTWEAISSEVFADNPNLYNLIALGDGSLLIAGERGFLARSTDKGATWTQLKSPYTGSYFGGLATGPSGVLIFGLRGNAFYAADIARAAPLTAKDLAAMRAAAADAEAAAGAQNPVSEVAGWVHLKHDDTEPLFGAAVEDGAIYLVGQNGRVMRADLAGGALERVPVPSDINMNAALADGKTLVTVGTSGISRLSLP